MDGVLERDLVEEMLFGTSESSRFTQDTPILPEVWFSYAERPAACLDLIVTPYGSTQPSEVAMTLYFWVTAQRSRQSGDGENIAAADIAYIRDFVAASLHFDELIAFVLPDTAWIERVRALSEGEFAALAKHYAEYVAQRIARAAERRVNPPPPGASDAAPPIWRPRDDRTQASNIVSMLALIGAILWLKRVDAVAGVRPEDAAKAIFREAETVFREARQRVHPGLDLLPERRAVRLSAMADAEADRPYDELDAMKRVKDRLRDRKPRVYLVAINRRVSTAVVRSVPATKADAARTLFEGSCSGIRWAIVDSGIDTRHPAFAHRDDPARCRVMAVYDFKNLRRLLGTALLGDAKERDEEAERVAMETGMEVQEAAGRLLHLARHAADGRPREWSLVEPLIQRPVGSAGEPRNGHGTHVAGILGADWRNADGRPVMQGMCPDIRLYDFRVLGADELDTEMNVIAALEFIRFLNERNNYLLIHGVNLSLSIPHNVRNYACGRTPVCEACERLVDSGVVVAAAAGNRGYTVFNTQDGDYPGYCLSSVTDPGNADGVITVGATHRDRPHTYGVSYFSSRGPTGDGRLKPDLVAPGEKIRGPLPNSNEGELSGTSMAAPHVSGAAALLLARYPELIGNPRRVKRILCDTATDLGRERHFQGRGMLDVLRAMQSI